MRSAAVRADRTRGAPAPGGAVSHGHRGRGRRGCGVAVRKIEAWAETHGRHIPPAPSLRAKNTVGTAMICFNNNWYYSSTTGSGGGGDTVPPRGSEISPSDAETEDASDSRFASSPFPFLFLLLQSLCENPVGGLAELPSSRQLRTNLFPRVAGSLLLNSSSLSFVFFRRFLSPLDDDDEEEGPIRRWRHEPTTPPCKPEAASRWPPRRGPCASSSGPSRGPWRPTPRTRSAFSLRRRVLFCDLRGDERVVHAVERARRLGARFRLQPRGRPAVVCGWRRHWPFRHCWQVGRRCVGSRRRPCCISRLARPTVTSLLVATPRRWAIQAVKSGHALLSRTRAPSR